MIRHIPPEAMTLSRKKWRTQMFIIYKFQYRYAVYMASLGLAISFIIGGITLYLLNHNYHLFIKAELLTAPRVADNLIRELKLANEVLIAAFLGLIAAMAIIGVKFSHRIAIPIYLIQERMRDICRGHLQNSQVNIRKSDEFQEFAETYNYLVESLKTQLRSDLVRLEKLKPDEHNRDAVHTWECLIREKNSQLNDSSSLTDLTGASRHAS